MFIAITQKNQFNKYFILNPYNKITLDFINNTLIEPKYDAINTYDINRNTL